MTSKPVHETLCYTLLPSANPPQEYLQLHSNVYLFWKNLWRDVFQKLSFPTDYLNDDFLRQDVIAVLHTPDEKVVATHLYTFFSLGSPVTKEHKYFEQNFPNPYYERLQEMGAKEVMTMEYMAVDPAWRKKYQQVHIGSILVGLAQEVLKASSADAAIAPARRDYKVNEIAYSFGADCVAAEVNNHNVSCDLIANFRDKICPHSSADVNQAITYLWENKNDSSGKKWGHQTIAYTKNNFDNLIHLNSLKVKKSA